MKKPGLYILLFVTGVLAAFVLGIFTGRNTGRSPVDISILKPEETTVHTTQQTDVPSTTSAGITSDGKVNINLATLEELMTLPGIGETYAKQIIRYRETHGSFSSADDLKKIAGIGDKRLDAIRDLIVTGG